VDHGAGAVRRLLQDLGLSGLQRALNAPPHCDQGIFYGQDAWTAATNLADLREPDLPAGRDHRYSGADN